MTEAARKSKGQYLLVLWTQPPKGTHDSIRAFLGDQALFGRGKGIGQVSLLLQGFMLFPCAIVVDHRVVGNSAEPGTERNAPDLEARQSPPHFQEHRLRQVFCHSDVAHAAVDVTVDHCEVALVEVSISFSVPLDRPSQQVLVAQKPLPFILSSRSTYERHASSLQPDCGMNSHTVQPIRLPRKGVRTRAFRTADCMEGVRRTHAGSIL